MLTSSGKVDECMTQLTGVAPGSAEISLVGVGVASAAATVGRCRLAR